MVAGEGCAAAGSPSPLPEGFAFDKRPSSLALANGSGICLHVLQGPKCMKTTAMGDKATELAAADLDSNPPASN